MNSGSHWWKKPLQAAAVVVVVTVLAILLDAAGVRFSSAVVPAVLWSLVVSCALGVMWRER